MTTEKVIEVTETTEAAVTSEPFNSEETTTSMAEALEAAQEMQDLSTVCDSESKEIDTSLESDIDDMRSAFYNTSLSLFEAAKSLKPYDILYTDTLLTQAQYFLKLADNYDMLNSMAKMISEMPLKGLSDKVPEEIVGQIDNYADAIKDRLSTMKKANVSDEVIANVDDIAKAIQDKLGKTAK